MTLSGEQWLAQVFRPAVAAVARFRSRDGTPVDSLRVLGARLAAQVEVLGDTGVLTDEQERSALDALEEAGIMPEVQSVSVSGHECGRVGHCAPACRGAETAGHAGRTTATRAPRRTSGDADLGRAVE